MSGPAWGDQDAGGAGSAALDLRAGTGELYLVTRVAGERFAFPVARVDEVVDAPNLLWVPGAASGLLGQIRHRDRTVPAYDAGWLFGVQAAADSGTALMLRHGESRVALVVDDAEDLQLVAPGDVQPVPQGADLEGVLRGVVFAGEGARARDLVSLVHVDAVLQRAAGGVVQGGGRR